MEDVLYFRNKMAEVGIEYTPAEAAKIEKLSDDLRKVVQDGGRKLYHQLLNLKHEDKQDLCYEFAEQGKEVTVKELDEMISIMMYMFQEENL